MLDSLDESEKKRLESKDPHFLGGGLLANSDFKIEDNYIKTASEIKL